MSGLQTDPDLVAEALEHMASYGVPGQHAHLFDVGTEKFLTHFRKEVLDLVASGGATCRFFQGNYGAGKSHLLRLIEHEALDRGMAVVRTDLSQALRLEDWKQVVTHILGAMEIEWNGAPVRSLPSILARLGKDPFLDRRHLPHPGFGQAMHLQWRNSDPNLRRFLLGEKVPYSLMRTTWPGVKDALSARNAEQVLQTVCLGLRNLGLPGLVLLFDENEKVFTRNTKQVRVAANLLRRVIDACVDGGLTGALFVFAILPEFLATCSREYPALGQRLSSQGLRVESAWRWPVLEIRALNTARSPKAFLKLAVNRMVELYRVARPDAPQHSVSLERDLTSRGEATLDEHADSGYRRSVMRALANTTVRYIER